VNGYETRIMTLTNFTMLLSVIRCIAVNESVGNHFRAFKHGGHELEVVTSHHQDLARPYFIAFAHGKSDGVYANSMRQQLIIN